MTTIYNMMPRKPPHKLAAGRQSRRQPREHNNKEKEDNMTQITHHHKTTRRSLAPRIMALAVALVATMAVTSCIDEEQPTDAATASQIEGSSSSFAMLVSGLNTKLISYNNYYTSNTGSWYETQDWGYPCYMLTKESLLDGFPIANSSYNYQNTYESATYLSAYTTPIYFFYYSLVNTVNNIINVAGENPASEAIQQSVAQARVYRALAYMDLSMMFEFWPTGIAELDGKAKDVMGLTVPIVTENTTDEEAKNNPRAPFYEMYRFIYDDLATAETALAFYSRKDKNEVNADVVNALMARYWLTLATRFRKHPADLQQMVAKDNDNSLKGRALGITTAEECYEKAQAYAQKVISAGYTPMTKSQWHDTTTGFNTANNAWVWDMRFSSIEQVPSYWCTIMGNVASEPTWGMPAYAGGYRCISKRLYDRIHDGDWRKTSWIDPADAGATIVPEKYKTQLRDADASTKASNTNFSRLPAYANLKFRPGSGSIDDDQKGLLCDIPLVRVEEMYFIMIECEFYLHGLDAGKQSLENFMTTYRTEGTEYKSAAEGWTDFIYEMIAQKYVELWGEGIMYNDYKRLGLYIVRLYDDTNYLEAYQFDWLGEGVAPWLNFYIPERERSFNKAMVMNPDPTPYCK